MKAFTLLEVLLYIAIFGLFMAGTIAVSYRLAINTEPDQNAFTTEETGNFVIRKIDTSLSSMSNAVLASTSEALITATDGTKIEIALAGGAVVIAENGQSPLPITPSYVPVTDLQFSLISASGSVPIGIAATATINGIDFTITRYAR